MLFQVPRETHVDRRLHAARRSTRHATRPHQLDFVPGKVVPPTHPRCKHVRKDKRGMGFFRVPNLSLSPRNLNPPTTLGLEVSARDNVGPKVGFISIYTIARSNAHERLAARAGSTRTRWSNAPWTVRFRTGRGGRTRRSDCTLVVERAGNVTRRQGVVEDQGSPWSMMTLTTLVEREPRTVMTDVLSQVSMPDENQPTMADEMIGMRPELSVILSSTR